MAANNKKTPDTIGFLTVCDFAEQGLFGGYLVLNMAGRPLEFHCTAPVRPNRAQEILYGPTLRPYLYGEQIGRVLLERAKAEPLLVFTDEEPALSVCTSASMPVVLVELSEDERRDGETGAVHRIDSGHSSLAPSRPKQLQRFNIADQQLAVLSERQDDQQIVAAHWEPHANDFDLSEPFGRIREAIDEARRTTR